MEYATGMLLAESALENYASLTPEFPKQVEAMLARASMRRAFGRPLAGAAAAPLLDEMSKRAQERLLLAQVGREIQANLRHMEQVLDAFFRDSSKRAELSTLAKDSQQIRGALKILGLAGRGTAARPVPGADRDLRESRDERCRTRTSSCSRNRCRGWASTSRPSSSSAPIASG